MNFGGGELTYIAVILLLVGLGIYGSRILSRLSRTRSKDSGGSSQEARERDAGFGRRCVAYVLDLVMICVPLLIGDVGLRLLVADKRTLAAAQNTLGWSIASLLFAAYFIGLWMNGGTLGQRVLGLKVVSQDGRVTFRQAVARLVALVVTQVVVVGIPFAFVFFIINRVRRRPFWHDTVSGTRVVARQAAIP